MFIERRFQIRYTLAMILVTFIGIAAALIPTMYLVQQNFDLFTELAYQNNPGLIDSIQRERLATYYIVGSVSVSVMVFVIILAFRLTSSIVGPLKVLRNHLRRLCRGHWHQGPLTVRSKDEFQDVLETYNYFFSQYKRHMQSEFDLIRRLEPEDKKSGLYREWLNYMTDRREQLGYLEPPAEMKATSTSSTDEPSPSSHRAS